MSLRHASKSVVDGLTLSRSSNYICRQCRRNAHPSQIASQQRHFASERPEDLPLAERVRRKLWKGKPPGPENVDELYGGPGVLETMYKERKERRAKKASGPSTEPSRDAPTGPRVSTKVAGQDEQSDIREQESGDRVLATPKRAPAVQSQLMPVEDSTILNREETALDKPEFRQATSWEGLPVIGHTGDSWKEAPVKAIDEYFQ